MPKIKTRLSGNWVIGPITILRCFRLPSGPASRHLTSQTSGPFERVDRMILPFCMASPFLLLVWSTKTPWSECHCGKWSRAEDSGGSDHVRKHEGEHKRHLPAFSIRTR